MARRQDGSARRYDVQVFCDSEQGRAIAKRLERVQQSGNSVSDFIREALWFFIQNETGEQPVIQPSQQSHLEREISALWEVIKSASQPVVTTHPGTVAPSQGLDMSPRRASRSSPPSSTRQAPVETAPTEFDASLAREQFLHSVRGFGQVRKDVGRG